MANKANVTIKNKKTKIEVLRDRIKEVQKRMDDLTSGQIRTALDDRETALAIREIITYAETCAFLELIIPNDPTQQ